MTVTAEWESSSDAISASLAAGTVRWAVDLDLANFGAGQAPTPHELLDSALAACAVLTLQLYSRRKQYPLKATTVDVSHADAGDLYRMTRRVSSSSPLTQQQPQDLLRVAKVCPVHEVLQARFEVATEMLP